MIKEKYKKNTKGEYNHSGWRIKPWMAIEKICSGDIIPSIVVFVTSEEDYEQLMSSESIIKSAYCQTVGNKNYAPIQFVVKL